jgi:heptosyltransferase-2
MLKADCSNFPGDTPCRYHKEQGIKCDDCNYYNPIKYKILIVKLDAVGDVLRTTALLPPLKEKYQNSHITWCTRKNAKELFKENPFVNETIIVEDDAYFRLKSEEFDLVINCDTSKISSSIASMANGKERAGFVLNKKGFVETTSKEAEQWLLMSAFDDVKNANVKTYQKIMYEIVKLDAEVVPPVLKIHENIKTKIINRSASWKYDKDKFTIGLNIGVGEKWPSKGLPLKRWKEVILKLKKEDANLFLLGGPDEIEKVKELKKEFNFLIDTGCDNSLLEFAAIVDLCDLIITADTLALHIATALNKKIIALFGPTSISEIELYGKGEKLISPDGCKCFYNKYCKEKISCMGKISAEMILNALRSLR